MLTTQANLFAGKGFCHVQLVLNHYGVTDMTFSVIVPNSADDREDLATIFERAAWLVRHAPMSEPAGA